MVRKLGVSVLVVFAACSTGGEGAARSSTTPATAPAATSGAAAPGGAAPGGADRAKEHGMVGLGFVLLDRADLPAASAVLAAYQRLAPDGPALGSPEHEDGTHTFTHGDAIASVALVPAPVPNGEADHHAQFTLLALSGEWQLPTHRAHLMVATLYRGTSALERTRTTHRLLAAVTAAAGSNAVGVYTGNGGVTHEPRFYIDAIAGDPEALVAWSGLSVARDGDRVSLISTGMRQLDLPDVEVTFETTPGSEAIAALYDVLYYLTRRGERLPAGDTIGRTEEERLPVRYVRSPRDPSVEIMRVDYP